jgi:hypothetical protein
MNGARAVDAWGIEREPVIETNPMGIRNRGPRLALLVAASLLLVPPTEAQEEISPAPVEIPTHPTSLETYLERPGILLVKQHHLLAPVGLRGGGEMRLDAIDVHEPGMQQQRVMGIRIEIDAPRLSDEEHVFFLDVHEIEELVRAIDFMMDAMDQEKPAREGDPTEIGISTKDHLEVGVQLSASGASPFLRTPSASFGLERAALETLREDLKRGREHLFSD